MIGVNREKRNFLWSLATTALSSGPGWIELITQAPDNFTDVFRLIASSGMTPIAFICGCITGYWFARWKGPNGSEPWNTKRVRLEKSTAYIGTDKATRDKIDTMVEIEKLKNKVRELEK